MKNNLIFLCILGIIFAVSIPLIRSGGGEGDFLAYWSASHLFVTGGNAYDQAEMSALQYATSPETFIDNPIIKIAWNPPWLILLLIPIGLLPYSIAVPAWIFCNTLIVGLSLIVAWKLCGGESKSRGILWVFIAGFLFVETIVYLASGQITGLLLLGILLSIYCLERKWDYYAGIALLLTTIKPHLSYFAVLLILIYILKYRRWKVLIGLVCAALASAIVFWIITPGWVKDYATLVSDLPYNLLYTSTIGSFVSTKFNTNIFKYLAVLLLFLFKPLINSVEKEGWLSSTNQALLLSLPISPFGFNFDQILILPSIVQIIYWSASHQLTRKTTLIIALSLVFVNLLIAKLTSINELEQYWFFWIPFAVLGIFLFAKHAKHNI